MQDKSDIKRAKPKILIEKNIPFIRSRLEKDAVVEYLDPADFNAETVKEADALIIRTRTRCDERLLKDSNVSLIVTATIGTDHIDLDYCREKGIRVANAPGCNAPGVAQYVWSALLNKGFVIGKSRLGVIGCGNVGKIISAWGLELGAEILVSDPPKSHEDQDWLSKTFDTDKCKGSIRQATLDEILSECDAITLHTPLTRTGSDPTFHLIGEKELEKMRQGAILINAARGEVVDSQALKSALEKGKARAVIDTWEGEPHPDSGLLSLVDIATPHIAGYSRQGKERATRMALENASRFFNIEADTTGLEKEYIAPRELTPHKITESYDPLADDRDLRRHPEEFEKLRKEYHYREEVE